MIEENMQAMTELAQAHGIKVILCSVTPVSDYGRTKTDPRPSAIRHPEDQCMDEGVCRESECGLCGLLFRAGR